MYGNLIESRKLSLKNRTKLIIINIKVQKLDTPTLEKLY